MILYTYTHNISCFFQMQIKMRCALAQHLLQSRWFGPQCHAEDSATPTTGFGSCRQFLGLSQMSWLSYAGSAGVSLTECMPNEVHNTSSASLTIPPQAPSTRFYHGQPPADGALEEGVGPWEVPARTSIRRKPTLAEDGCVTRRRGRLSEGWATPDEAYEKLLKKKQQHVRSPTPRINQYITVYIYIIY